MISRQRKWDTILLFASIIIIGIGVSARIFAFLINRSLWLDEAFLASSVVNRDFIGLCSPLDYKQGAPVGFLWITKTLTYLFGTSEYVLRLPSLISGLGSIPLFYLILKNVFKDPRPYIGTAFFATIPFLIYYSIEFKPYMFDVFLSLAIVYLFHLAIEKRIATWNLTLFCTFSLWFSFPAIFTVAAFCSLWVVHSVIQKQKEELYRSMSVGIISAISFLLYYVTLYSNLGENRSVGFWNLMKFPFIPHNLQDLKLMYLMGRHYLEIFGSPAHYLVAILSLVGIIMLLNKERRLFVVFVLLEAIIILIASWLGKYPILNRILLFYVPLHSLFIALTLGDMSRRLKQFGLFLSLIFILVNIGSIRYFLPKHIFRPGCEVNPIISKVESIRNGITIYIHAKAIPQYEYKTGYQGRLTNEPDLQPVTSNGVIYGTEYFHFAYNKPYSWDAVVDSNKLIQDISAIEANDKVYILTAMPIKLNTLLSSLQITGTLREIMNVYETRLYLYEKSDIEQKQGMDSSLFSKDHK